MRALSRLLDRLVARRAPPDAGERRGTTPRAKKARRDVSRRGLVTLAVGSVAIPAFLASFAFAGAGSVVGRVAQGAASLARKVTSTSSSTIVVRSSAVVAQYPPQPARNRPCPDC